jgi:multidrug efflux pump subunit AcrA (membrane-fusion protein)
VTLVILIAGTGVTALAYDTVRSQAAQLQANLTAHLQSAQSDLDAAKVSLHAANANHDTNQITQAEAHFTDAKAEFTVVSHIADTSQLLGRLEGLPAVGDVVRSRHTAIDGIAEMGIAICDAGQELSGLDGQIMKPPSSGGQQGRTLLTVLDQTHSSLVKVRADLDRARQAAARVDVRVLPSAQQGTFGSARGTISSALASIDEFERLVPVMTELLGGNGARTYLIEQVNPAELRPGGGFIGTFSLIQADHGTLKLIKSGPATDLIGTRASPGQPGYIVPPGPIHEFVPNTGWSFIDSNFFPDFPSNAVAGENFAQPKLGEHIDAVISMDYYTVARMLGLTGPLPVPGTGLTVDAGNFVAEIVQLDIDASPVHKTILSAVAGPLMDRLSTLPPTGWPALITALNDLAAGRHLQAYFNNDQVQKEIDKVGWSGTLNPTGSKDYMIEVESNLGGTKANYFVVRHFTVNLTRMGALLHHTVTIDLQDNMPFSYRPDEFYRAYIRLYVSDTATSASDNLRAVVYPNPAPPAGLSMIDGWVPLFHGYGHSARAVFEYDTPWLPNGRGEGRMYWQKQPGTVSDAVVVNWNDGYGHTFTASGDLTRDRVITFSSKGISILSGQPASAALPNLSLG